LVFEVVVSHTKKILSVSGKQYGTDNNKMILRSNAAILRACKDGGILKESSFKHYLADGSEAEEKGCYYIMEGGYKTWIELIAPFKHEPKAI
jgi:hypothetical protein